MGSILSAVVSLFAFRFRSRASLEFELIALRHQLTVLRPSPRSAACIIAMSVELRKMGETARCCPCARLRQIEF